jgi:hypothetical protein
MDAFDVSQLLNAIDRARGSSGRVPHLFRDVGHRQRVFAGKIGQQEELRVGKITSVQLLGEIQDAAALGEQDEVCETAGIGLDGSTWSAR